MSKEYPDVLAMLIRTAGSLEDAAANYRTAHESTEPDKRDGHWLPDARYNEARARQYRAAIARLTSNVVTPCPENYPNGVGMGNGQHDVECYGVDHDVKVHCMDCDQHFTIISTDATQQDAQERTE